ncbi:MAG: hypothetical protein LAP87_26335 [Acidobacteriia bacterium]|nr:hypothetical protein [Terriglobia bacterium]
MPFHLFSARHKPPPGNLPYQYDNIPQAFRTQAWYILEKSLGKLYVEPGEYRYASFSHGLWTLIRGTLREERGVFCLSSQGVYLSLGPKAECLQFFISETDLLGALDFIDLAFRVVDRAVRAAQPHQLEGAECEIGPDEAIRQLNQRFDQHHLGYQFTGGEVMRRDSQFTHAEITEAAARLLTAKGFDGPNHEFFSAHKAYLKGNTKEAIRESLNALESTLKVICLQRKWKFDPQKDTSAKLLSIVFENGLVADYLQSHFGALRTTLERECPP